MIATAGNRRAPRVEILSVAGAGLIATILSIAGIARPAFWYDEAATFSGATRSFSDLIGMTANVDAVHGAYYAMMNVVVRMGGASEFASRLPSALAVVATCVVVYLIVRQNENWVVSASAAITLLALPRSIWMATEARSFAIATLLAALTTLIFLRALRRPALWTALVYPVVATVAVWVFMYNALVLVAHGLAIVLVARTRRGAILFGGLIVSALASAPLLITVAGQRGQLGGVHEIGVDTPRDIVVEQFFMDWWPAAVLGVGTLLLALVVLAIRRGRDDVPDVAGSGGRRLLMVTSLGWLAIPPVVIVGYSALATSVYQPRAMSICAPALAILFAVIINRAFTSRVALGAAVLILLVSIPWYTSVREPFAKGTDWRQTSEVIADISPRPEAVWYLPPATVQSYSALISLLYPATTTEMVDMTLLASRFTDGRLFDPRLPADAPVTVPDSVDELILVGHEELDPHEVSAARASLQAQGFSIQSTTVVELTWVETYARESR